MSRRRLLVERQVQCRDGNVFEVTLYLYYEMAELHSIDGMCMSSCRKWRLQDRQVFRPSVPQQDLSGIRTTEHKVCVERREGN